MSNASSQLGVLRWAALARRLQRIKLAGYLGLLLVLGFAFYIAYIPHRDYPYPLHVDEWLHYGMGQALVEAEGLGFTEPFFGEEKVTDHPEIGFYLLLSQIKLFTGLSWPEIFRFFPGIIFLMTVLGAYVFGRRGGFGLEAALFVALIPTTTRTLGPSFLVPVALGISFLPLILWLAHYSEMGRAQALLLTLLLSALFLIHPPTGTAASLVLVIYAFAHLLEGWGQGGQRWRAPGLILGSVIASSLAVILRFHPLVLKELEKLGEGGEKYHLPLVRDAVGKFGYVPLALFGLGVFLLLLQGKARDQALAYCSLAFAVLLFTFSRLNFGIGIMYDRGWTYFFLVAGIIAGFALRGAREEFSQYLGKHLKKASILALLLVLALALASAAQALKSHLDEPYYRLVDDRTYADFLWIRDNLDADFRRAIVDPEISAAFPPITGRYIYASYAAPLFNSQRSREAQQFLNDGAVDTQWLRGHGLNLVYTERPVDNPDLERVRDRIYLLR